MSSTYPICDSVHSWEIYFEHSETIGGRRSPYHCFRVWVDSKWAVSFFMIIYHNNWRDMIISSWHARFQAKFTGVNSFARNMFNLSVSIFFVQKILNISKDYTWNLNCKSERRISFDYWVTVSAQKCYTTTLYEDL